MTYTCEFCGASFEKAEELRRHLMTQHRNKMRLIKLEHPRTRARTMVIRPLLLSW